MALTWGSVSGHLRVGLNTYIRSSDEALVCSVYVSTDDYGSGGYTWNGADSITVSLNGPGSYDDSWTFSPKLSAAWEQVYVGQVIIPASAMSMGSSYSFSASASGLHTGGTPSHSKSESATGAIPKASKPSASGISSSGATINWSKPSNATSIQIQVDNSSGFGSPHSDYRDADSPSSPFAGTGSVSSGYIGGDGSPYTTYYARIRGYNGNYNEYGNWSDTLSFRLDAVKPSSPGQPSISSIGTGSATASWGDPSNWGGDNTSDFDVQISTNSSFSGASTYTVYNANSRAFTGLSPNTTYYVRVRAFNAAGDGSWSSTRSFTTNIAKPSPPRSPSHSGVDANGANLSWSSPTDWGGDNTGDYEVQWWETGNYAATQQSFRVYNTTSVHLTSAPAGTSISWRVRAQNDSWSQFSDWTGTDDFTTQGVPTAPTNLTLVNAGPIGASFSWSDPAAWNGEDSGDFIVSYRKVGGTWTIVTVYNKNSYTIPSPLDPNSQYEWTVRAVNAFGEGPNAAFKTFTTSAPPLFVKVNDAQRSVAAAFVKVGTQRTVVRAWAKVAGTYR